MLRSSTKITNQAHTYSYDTPLACSRSPVPHDPHAAPAVIQAPPT